MKINFLTTIENYLLANEKLTEVIKNTNLPIECNWQTLDSINNKALKQLANDISNPFLTNPFLIVELAKNDTLVCTLGTVENNDKGKPTLTKVSPDWHKLQRRIVTAGRKSELLLQACKLTADSKVLDATAGFGHDSLIMASSGAKVTMMEQHPIMALLLMLERKRMNTEKNWQGLMGRLDVRFGRFPDDLDVIDGDVVKYDTLYLDPMFPNDSYEGAKVGKGMQVLHNLATPPTLKEEQQLLQMAKSLLTEGGRVVVKRPKNAPYLAGKPADESWMNDVVRFDGYFG